jgi:CBS domain-containing protein
MDPKLRQLLDERGGDFYMIAETATLKELVTFLREKGIGAVLVSNEAGRVSGLISERDVVRKLAETDAQIQELAVKYVMTPRERLMTGSVEDRIDALLNAMQERGVRHIPIVDHDGTFLALLSSRDFIRVLLEHTTRENRQLRDFIYGHYPL